ncbi:MAG: phosphoenolpyruvate--protein phosphotransferase [Synechococcales cyanobacterium T60_A2020_003]|nr:phosphoenolpyruvate--protein phosphotransferase [Synechococcales cyanobacterium T60_A2020_003]
MSYTATPAKVSAGFSLVAPLSGHIIPIEQVPDPVFAEKMVGDGISIDPTSQVLLAPCDGDVIQLHPACHAVTVQTVDGLEVLMHIGLDTVELHGKGFTARVKEGDRVKLGDPLIEFDADFVALRARSLLTQIVITNSDRVARFTPLTGNVVAGQDVVLELTLGIPEAEEGPDQGGEEVVSEAITIANPAGLHARPAAVLANLAKKYKSDISIHRGADQANAKSVIAVMGLQIGNGDVVTLQATGADASEAVLKLTEAIRDGLGEAGKAPAPAPASIAQSDLNAPPPRPRSVDPNLILGASASPGVAVGHVQHVRQIDIQVHETGDRPEVERRKLEHAIDQAKLEVEALRAKVHGQGDPSKAAIFAAHQELLEDPGLMDMALSAIDKGKSAEFSWKQTYTAQAKQLAGLQNELLAQRANDVRDVGMRVLRILTGVVATVPTYPENTILVAEDLIPSDMANLDRAKVVGFCTLAGGATSHVAILARSMGIPAIAGTEPSVMDLPDGTPVILDGSKGTLRLNATAEELETVRMRIARQKAKRDADLRVADQPAVTTDGQRIEVVANIGGIKDAEEAMPLGAEGVGLLRTEFIFMDRASAPTEDEQTAIYRSILEVLGRDRPMILRTLDVGGDKPLTYLPIPHEENPFLGERGVRIGFDRPDILRTQLRAVLRASTAGKLRVMFPMIGRMEEIRMVKGMLDEERLKLGADPIEVGIMIEIPAAAVMAEQFAKEVDFFSVGTNDLTQYTLAMDRGHPKLAPYVDGLNPAVLRLIHQAVEGASHHGKWVGVCGGIASDPQAVPILIGLGVRELSVSVSVIPSIKAQVRSLSFTHCQELAAKALALETAAEVRALVSVED